MALNFMFTRRMCNAKACEERERGKERERERQGKEMEKRERESKVASAGKRDLSSTPD